jgi:type I restriction-modification system DNA methylase subunit
MLETEEPPLSTEKDLPGIAAPEDTRRQIESLVQRFARNLEVYTRPDYKETQVRVEFIDPFFEALDWDVRNVQGYAEPYKDVIHEDAIKVSGATKAPDYCFRVGGVRKFFLEAKKPSVPVKGEVGPAYQLRRYAWSAKLPLSILTDFQEFAVYDCRQKPQPTDKAGVGRVLYYTFDEYLDHLNEIYSIFAREAVLKGSFDRYVLDTRGKRGTGEVDVEFLKEIEGWRDELARNIALRNPALSVYELNFAVQRTIDRIIFLRMCEDRGIEGYGRLLALTAGPHIYARMGELYREADEKYNSDLFDFKADTLTRSLTLDDKTLQPILAGLYYPDSPYEFSVLPTEILGQVYEQFLGKVIRLTAGHRAKVEEKPEVKKAGGVYYTPSYIVEYIVQQTVGRLLEGKTPQQISKLHILDPACGSGSFLLGAYQRLLDYHRQWYEGHDPQQLAKAKRPAIYQGRGGEWRLTTGEKKRILLNNIYGVDIDRQAVEVTKLSLLLRVLEGENQETLGQQLKLWRERALPDLGENIKCGNSLIGPDYFEGQLMPDEEEMRRVNPFDWEKEFPDIMAAGGFDAVIGNPPYLRVQGLQEHYGDQIDYLTRRFQSAVKRFDLYLLFAEKGFELLREQGRLGFICPHKFLNSDFGSGLRAFLVNNSALSSFISLGNNLVFRDASTYTGLLLLVKDQDTSFTYCELPDMPISELQTGLVGLGEKDLAHYDLQDLTEKPWTLTNRHAQHVLSVLSRQPSTLGDIAQEILVGVQSGIDSVHVVRRIAEPVGQIVRVFSESAGSPVDIELAAVKPFLRGEDVHRYSEPQYSHYCIYPYRLVGGKTRIFEELELRDRFPLAYEYLKEYRTELTDKRKQQKTNPRYWYSCHRSRDMAVFETDRIITPEISLGCNMTIAPAGLYHNTMVYSVVPSVNNQEHKLYWLGLLNSTLLWWYLSNTGTVLRGGYFRFKTNYLKPFPCRTINFDSPEDVGRQNRMVTLVQRMLDLHKKLHAAAIPADKKLYQRQIEATDEEIDALVYELYGLTEEQIGVVEDTARARVME